VYSEMWDMLFPGHENPLFAGHLLLVGGLSATGLDTRAQTAASRGARLHSRGSNTRAVHDSLRHLRH